MLLRSIQFNVLVYCLALISYGQPVRENNSELSGAYQLDGLLTKVDGGKVINASAMLSTDDGKNFDLTIIWQVGNYHTTDHLIKLKGDLVSKGRGLHKIRLTGIYDQDGSKHSKSRPPFPVIAWLEIDVNQSKGTGKSRTNFYNVKSEEITWEFLSVQSL